METVTDERTRNLMQALARKYPKHVIGIANGKVTRRIPTRYHVGKGSHTHHGKGRIVVRHVLAAVYNPETYQL